MRAVAKPPAAAPTVLMSRCVGYVQNGATYTLGSTPRNAASVVIVTPRNTINTVMPRPASRANAGRRLLELGIGGRAGSFIPPAPVSETGGARGGRRSRS